MLISDFLKHFQNASKWARVNVDSVESYGLNYEILTTDVIDEADYRIEELKEDIESNEQVIKDLEKEKENLENQNKELEDKVETLSKWFAGVSENKKESFKELLEKNEWQAQEIEEYKKQSDDWYKKYLDLMAETRKLQARKNKASIERDVTSGLLIAEYQGVKYLLTKL